MSSSFDCIVCGSCVVDVLVRPVALDRPIGSGALVRTEPLELTTGGIVSNSGITMARLGMRVGALTYVGDDAWGNVFRQRFEAEGVDTTHLVPHPSAPSSTSAVIVNERGERSFLHAAGAPKMLDKRFMLDHLDLFARCRAMLLGYYPLLPNLQDDLPEVLAAIRATGCMTALDASGDGGEMEPLKPCLPHLDFYVPSQKEALHQTGEREPQRMLEAYRSAGAAGMVGVKLGADGALLSPTPNEFIVVQSVTPPGDVVDTTGAGDCFFGGLIAGMLNGLAPKAAGQLAAAVGACCVTGLGATTSIRNYDESAKLAGIGTHE